MARQPLGKSPTLHAVISERLLQQMAGARTYARGEEYFRGGKVLQLAEYHERITAGVRGTRRYDVLLGISGKTLTWGCSCPSMPATVCLRR